MFRLRLILNKCQCAGAAGAQTVCTAPSVHKVTCTVGTLTDELIWLKPLPSQRGL